MVSIQDLIDDTIVLEIEVHAHRRSDRRRRYRPTCSCCMDLSQDTLTDGLQRLATTGGWRTPDPAVHHS